MPNGLMRANSQAPTTSHVATVPYKRYKGSAAALAHARGGPPRCSLAAMNVLENALVGSCWKRTLFLQKEKKG